MMIEEKIYQVEGEGVAVEGEQLHQPGRELRPNQELVTSRVSEPRPSRIRHPQDLMVSQKSDMDVVALGFADRLTADCIEEKQPQRNQRIVHSQAML